jgi:very-short-patch-repair endonuclease
MQKRFIHNNRELTERRKDLRNNATSQEKILWQYLKGKKVGFKFQRQHSIGAYITDFYCPEKKLIIEIDGSQHRENKEYDQLRTNYFEAQGYTVLRFWNSEIDLNIFKVLERIQECLTPKLAS